MAALSIRDLDDGVRDRLRLQAARHGRSMEAEARAILTDAVAVADDRPDLFTSLVQRFGALGGVDLDIPRRRERPRRDEFPE